MSDWRNFLQRALEAPVSAPRPRPMRRTLPFAPDLYDPFQAATYRPIGDAAEIRRRMEREARAAETVTP